MSEGGAFGQKKPLAALLQIKRRLKEGPHAAQIRDSLRSGTAAVTRRKKTGKTCVAMAGATAGYALLASG